MRHTPLLVSLSVLTILTLTSRAEDWPRFRGPGGAGISSDPEVSLTWSETDNLAWKADLPGPGSSSPIVRGDHLFITCYSGYGESDGSGDLLTLDRHLLCFHSGTGAPLWRRTFPAPLPEDAYQGFIGEHGYASHTPATDGERVYAFFGKGGVVALDFEGNELWRRDVGSRPSSKGWGTSASPITHQGLLIVNAAEESNTLYALDGATGDVVWKTGDPALVSIYGAPMIASKHADTLIVSVPGEIRGFDPATGATRWTHPTEITGNVSPSPVLAGDRLIQFGGYPRTLGIGLKLGADAPQQLWQNNDARSYLTSPCYFEGKLYWVTDQGIACCADPDTGELLYEERLDTASGGGRGKPFYASPIIVNGHLLAVSRTAGTYVIAAKPEFELVRVNTIAGDPSRFQGTPAVSGGRLFLRSDKALYAIGAP